MNLFKRAITSTIRNLGKTIILFLLVFILGTMIAGAISVHGAIHNTDNNLRRNMRPIVSIGVDIDPYMEYLNSFDYVTTFPINRGVLRLDEIHIIGALEYIYSYDYALRTTLRSRDLVRDWTSEYNIFNPAISDSSMTHFHIVGTRHTELVQVEQEAIYITQGRQFEPYEHIPSIKPIAAIVSEEFARWNDLSINSVFTLNEWYRYMQVGDHPNDRHLDADWQFEIEEIFLHLEFEFEIIGFFALGERIDETDYLEADLRFNHLSTIYAPNWAVEKIRTELNQSRIFQQETFGIENAWTTEFVLTASTYASPIFILEDPLYIDDFKIAVEPYLPRFMIVDDLSRSFEPIASSMITFRNIANGILIGTIGAALLILSTLICLFLRDRRYELGIYLALGEKKGRVIYQILIEVLVISFIAMTMSVFLGNIVADVVSHNMLINELMAETDDSDWPVSLPQGELANLGFQTRMSIDDMIEAFDVSLTIREVSLLYIVGLGTIVLSTLVSIVYVVKLNPKSILLRSNIG